MKTELTLAVPTKELWDILEYEKNGVIIESDINIMSRILTKGVFRHRNELEEDVNYKQIIPYAIICCKDFVYMFKRTNKQTEKRLHNLYSLGVGGHMNPWGNTINIQYLHHELERELNEEVLVKEECKIMSLTPLGFINDDTNEVGKVHIGVLYEIELNNLNIEINEKDKMTGEWILKGELRKYYDTMESWSKIYLNTIKKSERI